MNAWFAGGVLAGILAVAIYGVLKKRKESAPRYDERQAQARANAAKLALEVLAALMLVNGFVREAWQFAWAGPFMETVVLLLIAGTVYVLRCVWTDAYFALREKPKTWGRIFAAMLVVNAALGVMVILDGDMVEDGLLTFPGAQAPQGRAGGGGGMKNLRLKAARAALDLSQQELAERVGVSRQTINAIEKGDYNPTINLCLKICHALGKTLDDLFWE